MVKSLINETELVTLARNLPITLNSSKQNRNCNVKFTVKYVCVYHRKFENLSLTFISKATNHNSWFSLTRCDGHVGVQNNGKMSLKFCIIIESNFQKTFFAIVLFTNMAAVTSRENRELIGAHKLDI